jgi:VanZ family protein
MNEWSTKRTAGWMLVFILALMLYGSLQPFHLRHVDFDSPLDLLLRLRWGYSQKGDMLVNVLLYMPFAATLAWLLPERWPVIARLAFATACGFLISLSVEVSQWFIVTRVASLADVTMNTTGTLLGCAAGLAVRARGGDLSHDDRFRFTTEPVGAMLLLCWLGSFLPAWWPHLAVRQWPALWAQRFDAGWPGWQPVAMQALGWLIAGSLLRALTRPSWVRPALAVLAVLALSVRFTFFVQFAGNAELLGAGVAVLAWPFLAPLPDSWRMRLLSAALLAGLLYRGLSPFEFGPLRHDFHWMPFTDLVSHVGTGFNLPLLAGKAFTYGTLVWLVVAAGSPALRSGLFIGGILFAIEVAQLGLPAGGHFATLTDPVIAVLAGFVLKILGKSGTSAAARPTRARPAAAPA